MVNTYRINISKNCTNYGVCPPNQSIQYNSNDDNSNVWFYELPQTKQSAALFQ